MKYIVLFVALMISNSVFACFKADGVEFDITGKIVPAIYKTEDFIAHYKALELMKPACFLPDGELSDKSVNISKIQLSVPEGVSIDVGNSYSIKGNAFHSHTGHHFTKIVIEVKSAEKL
ncbi:DUF4431 domain-containing protein [Pseudoalteromonas rubra]|uniref:DUF4431 domain-containing protein n=1 Tax=Pseudoalteromonas rubra TaxID=43658 RepID=UPI0013DDED2B|nr:DUF4431 domain-containing protein [Pseudoalteromonas rubra]